MTSKLLYSNLWMAPHEETWKRMKIPYSININNLGTFLHKAKSNLRNQPLLQNKIVAFTLKELSIGVIFVI